MCCDLADVSAGNFDYSLVCDKNHYFNFFFLNFFHMHQRVPVGRVSPALSWIKGV